MPHGFGRRRRAEMHVRRFPAHRPQQTQLVFRVGQGCQRDPHTVWGQAPQHPFAAQLDIWVPAADCIRQQGLIQDFERSLPLVRPEPGRRHQRFGLAGDLPAFPVCKTHKTLMPEAAKPTAAAQCPVRRLRTRQQMLDAFTGGERNLFFGFRQRPHLFPKLAGIGQTFLSKTAQPKVVFCQHKRLTPCFQPRFVAVQDCRAGRAVFARNPFR